MPEVYRKRGSVLRYEHETLIRATEAGEAIEEDGTFRCRPWTGTPRLPELDQTSVREVVDRIRSAVPGKVDIERLIVTDGMAEHWFNDRTWSDRHRRIHLALRRDRHRVLLDEGSFDTGGIERVASLLAQADSERRPPLTRIRLAPRVMAALTPQLAGIAPPNVIIEQRGGGVDGKGLPIADAGAGWYRPSYRVRPVRAPLNVAARCSVTTVEQSLPEAVALLARPDELVLNILCVDGAAVFPATFRIIRIDAISDQTTWYPVETGVWAGEAEVA